MSSTAGLSLALIAAIAFLLAAAAGLRRTGPPVALFFTISLLLSSRVLAPVAMIVPIYVIAHAANLLDTRTILILVYAAVNLPVALWLLQPVIGLKATEQEEAARLEGASHLTALFGILLPMVRGGLAATGLIVFLLCWNEYLFAAYLTLDHALTVPPWMVGQQSMKEAQTGGEAEELAHLSAAAVLMIASAVALVIAALRLLAGSISGRART
jgi:ABC-type glycerol-3-phosphate transport system permease component